jgi:hypothetical protein
MDELDADAYTHTHELPRQEARSANRGPPSISDLSDDSKVEPYVRDAKAWS